MFVPDGDDAAAAAVVATDGAVLENSPPRLGKDCRCWDNWLSCSIVQLKTRLAG